MAFQAPRRRQKLLLVFQLLEGGPAPQGTMVATVAVAGCFPCLDYLRAPAVGPKHPPLRVAQKRKMLA